MLVACVCTDGEMDVFDVRSECVEANWLPILTMPLDADGRFAVPLFPTEKMAQQFMRRNLPENWTTGTIELDVADIRNMAENPNCQIVEMQFPNKLKDRCDFDVEIVSFPQGSEILLRSKGGRLTKFDDLFQKRPKSLTQSGN